MPNVIFTLGSPCPSHDGDPDGAFLHPSAQGSKEEGAETHKDDGSHLRVLRSQLPAWGHGQRGEYLT